MIKLSISYETNIKNVDMPFPFGEAIRNEIIAAHLMNENIISGNFTLGEQNNHLPDLISEDREYGYEIVQSELAEDLNMKYVLSALEKCDYKESETKQFLEENKLTHPANAKEYVFFEGDNGKIGYGPNSGAHSPNYYIPIFKKNLDMKLDKLAEGSYSNCKKTALIVNLYSRLKTYDDAMKIFECFGEAQEKRKCKFFNLYLITSTAIYFLSENNSLESIGISATQWGTCIGETDKILKNLTTGE